ncbi:AraC-like ligand-binding domain-containing protein [Corynebacterium epidermidicanis]|uniref:Transcriptional regulator, AraC family n=1 Tax=Corynebacterium epidermidicanis TaxID=1050174 RepID=A0A0G3GXZ7_9CORY|nr:helix-turn-helix domain-containing protein [Corynebacterium epidermidicanis]AKK03692.1 transcriptional regulator, AraC family [Corynebacterium epidermidicanis]
MAEHTLAQWRSAASSYFGRLQVSAPDAAGFRAQLRVANLGEVMLFDMHTPAHHVSRSPADIDEHNIPYCKLSLQLAGHSTLTQDGRTATLTPGDLALYVSQRPYELDYQCEQRTLVVFFPQRLLTATPAQISALTAKPISKNDGLGRVAIPLFEQLATNIDILDGAHAEALVRSALNMLISVFANEIPNEPSNLLFRQATAYIDQHLADPDLSPTTIATALFVSVRHLHAQFSREGLTAAAYIRGRRLSRIRDDLTNPQFISEPIQAIAARHGLIDASHFSRAFKAEFGESPKAYQAKHS